MRGLRGPYRINDKEWRHAFWEKSVPWVIGMCFLIIMVALPTIVYQQYQNNRSQNNHHAASNKQQNTIIGLQHQILIKDTAIRNAQMENKGTLTAIANLQQEFVGFVATLPADSAALVAGQAQLNSALAALCAATHASCPIPPKT